MCKFALASPCHPIGNNKSRMSPFKVTPGSTSLVATSPFISLSGMIFVVVHKHLQAHFHFLPLLPLPTHFPFCAFLKTGAGFLPISWFYQLHPMGSFCESLILALALWKSNIKVLLWAWVGGKVLVARTAKGHVRHVQCLGVPAHGTKIEQLLWSCEVERRELSILNLAARMGQQLPGASWQIPDAGEKRR